MKKVVRIESPRDREEQRIRINKASENVDRKRSEDVNDGGIGLPPCQRPCGGHTTDGTIITDEDGVPIGETNCDPDAETELVPLVVWTWTTGTADDSGIYASHVGRHATDHFLPNGALIMPGPHGDLGSTGRSTAQVSMVHSGLLFSAVWVQMDFRWKWEPKDRPIYVDFFNGLGGPRTDRQLFAGPGLGVDTLYELSKLHVAPNGSTHVAITWPSFHGGSIVDNMKISVMITDVGPCVPTTEDVGTGEHISGEAYSSGSNWLMPSNASYIYSVSVDGIPRTDYDFVPPSTINFATPVPSGAQVNVEYFYG